MFLDELHDRLSAMSRMWEPALEVMKAGSGFTRTDLSQLKKFHSRTLTSLSEMAEAVKQNNWSQPRYLFMYILKINNCMPFVLGDYVLYYVAAVASVLKLLE